jgi:hypothetical protein
VLACRLQNRTILSLAAKIQREEERERGRGKGGKRRKRRRKEGKRKGERGRRKGEREKRERGKGKRERRRGKEGEGERGRSRETDSCCISRLADVTSIESLPLRTEGQRWSRSTDEQQVTTTHGTSALSPSRPLCL